MVMPTDSVKISQLPAQTSSSPSDMMPVVHGGITEQGSPALFSTDWTSLSILPTTIVYNGNRSYTLTYPGVDYTSVLNPGKRLSLTSTVALPTQSVSLNGTTQYLSRIAPSGMTFTDDFVSGAWVKLSNYAQGMIESRYNGTSGWRLNVESTGQVTLAGLNGGAGNYSFVQSYQSIPLNKWVHIAAQLDMSSFTATTTTSYVMIDGVDVPATVGRSGTNPTALIQAGNLEIGSQNGGLNPFPGKIAQAFVSSAKITQANIRTLYSQGITAALIATNNIISAYSFSNSLNDLNTTTANNLTANGAASATNNDSFTGQQANGNISSSLNFGIIQKVSFSTDTTVTLQVPEGNTIPTTGGISATAFSGVKAPFGMPVQKGKWTVLMMSATDTAGSVPAISTWYNNWNFSLSVPAGEWELGYFVNAEQDGSVSSISVYRTGLGTSTSSALTNLSSGTVIGSSAGVTFVVAGSSASDDMSVSTATPYYLNYYVESGGGTMTLNTRGTRAYTKIYARNAYL